MDSRHETQIQELLNHLIREINVYIAEHLDEVVNSPHLMHELERIVQVIYEAAGEDEIDASELISKHNLLAVHPIILPFITELTEDDDSRLQPIIKVISEVACPENTVMARQLLPRLDEILCQITSNF